MNGPAKGLLLPVEYIHAAVEEFMKATPSARRWDVDTDIDWELADANKLSDGERSAVQFVTIIEDHLPGYFSHFCERFPVDSSIDEDAYIHNREAYHFEIRWAQEEDVHARALERYQIESGMTTRESLRNSLAREGQKPFDVPFELAVQLFTYPTIQEKATQIYYQHLKSVVSDPALGQVLVRLSRDEARHFSFFATCLELYLREYGDLVADQIRDVIAEFRMPLADTIRGYWRWALKISDVARYDHTESYDYLIAIVNRAVNVRTRKVDELLRFLSEYRRINITT
jgi:acyl-[acyl-carrier-protein] desaturase